jgi:predicted ATPase
LKPLTVLAGANGSGKSNILRSLSILMKMMYSESPPPSDYIQEVMWVEKANGISFELQAKVENVPVVYKLELKSSGKVNVEKLMIGEILVISVSNGKGNVMDENGKNKTRYCPNKPRLALNSVSNYGEKPVTSALTDFIQGWDFYDFNPDIMRIYKNNKRLSETPILDGDGSTLKNILSYWFEKDKKRVESINEAFENCIKRRIEYKKDDDELYLWEGCKKPISIKKASDGTMRLLAYQVLLNHPHIPSLIAIEEPERNFHPAALKEIAGILERLAERTQVIITTHSSQLLDAFNPESLTSGKMGVLLLQNVPGKGTQIMNLEEIRKDREALDGWISDFGIGSAIFDSELLQDIMKDKPCQA